VERDVDDLDAGSRKRKGFCNGGLHEPPGVGESPIAQAGNEAGARFARIPLRAVTVEAAALDGAAHEAFVRVAGDHPKSPEKIYLDLASRREPDSKRRGCFKSIGGLPSMARPTSMKSSPATRNHLPNRRISLPLPTTWKDRH
jgi:hypothetical protein